MNLRDLEYFVKLAEHKHFGKAASASFVSQPTLSMQVKKLEEELGVNLFYREDKNIRLTKAGTLLIPQARLALEAAKTMKLQAKTLQDPFALPFRLGIITTIAPYYLPQILPTLQQKLPNLQLILIEDKTENLLNQLTNHDIDAALLGLPIKHTFKEHILLRENFVAALPKQHPLVKKSKLSIKDLKTENLLMLEEGHCLRDHALQFCKHFDTHKETYRATSLETLCQMVGLGHGITLLPEFASKQRENLAIRPIQTPTPYRDIGLVWAESSIRQSIIQTLIKSMLS
jgi:LysR family hydrogen peroxide-inducible transcriptional activator